MKIIIDVDVLETQEKTHLLRLHTGFGDPEIRVAVDLVKFARPYRDGAYLESPTPHPPQPPHDVNHCHTVSQCFPALPVNP
ncbi:MAG: hypothetical protein OK454_00035 [Thaumarchaeota archaeon]|nr:hypothetical protein [Nitrososphaerota archaeon]